MADLIRGTTPSYIVDFTNSGVDVAGISKITPIIYGEFNFFNSQYSED